MRREHASVAGLARQLGTTWRTVWRAVKPLLVAMAADPARFDGVTTLGVDEHVWHHVSTKPVEDGGRGPKELTGMVDLTRDQDGRVHARLLDLVPGRSGKAYADWLQQRGEVFTQGVEVATLDPFHGYKNAIDDELQYATAVLDAFHVIKLGSQVVDDVRRRVQQDTLGHRGRKGDPLYGIRNTPRAGAEKLTDRQWARPEKGPGRPPRARRRLGRVVRRPTTPPGLPPPQADRGPQGRRTAARHAAGLSHPGGRAPGKDAQAVAGRVPGLLHHQRLQQRPSNGGTQAVNGLIELHRRVARGFRNLTNYRLRMLIGGGLSDPRL